MRRPHIFKKTKKNSHLFWWNSCFYPIASKQVGFFLQILWPFSFFRKPKLWLSNQWWRFVELGGLLRKHELYECMRSQSKMLISNRWIRGFMSNFPKNLEQYLVPRYLLITNIIRKANPVVQCCSCCLHMKNGKVQIFWEGKIILKKPPIFF